MPKLSPQGLILFQRMMEDTVFVKRQQWATTNYSALIYAAIVFLNEKVSRTPTLTCILSTTAILTAFIATVLLIWFQYDLYMIRKRLEKVTNYSFVGAEKENFEIRPDKHPFVRGLHILQHSSLSASSVPY
jgi:hypothetical protein